MPTSLQNLVKTAKRILIAFNQNASLRRRSEKGIVALHFIRVSTACQSKSTNEVEKRITPKAPLRRPEHRFSVYGGRFTFPLGPELRGSPNEMGLDD